MAGVFSEVFDSNVLKEKIAEELGEDSINETIQATVIEETNLITLQVTSENLEGVSGDPVCHPEL